MWGRWGRGGLICVTWLFFFFFVFEWDTGRGNGNDSA